MYRILDNSESLGLLLNCENNISNKQTSTNISTKVLSDVSTSNKTLIGDNTLRILRTAIIITGEYSDYFVNKFQLGSSNETVKKTAMLGAIVSSLNNLNIVFEKIFRHPF